MKFLLLDVFIGMAAVLVLVPPLPAQESQPEKQKQFIYVLHLVPRLYGAANWTNEDKKVLQRHFVRFQEAIKAASSSLPGALPNPAIRHLASRYSTRKMKLRPGSSWKKIPLSLAA